MNRKTLTPLREERFEFLDWKVPGQSFYTRKGDGRFWVVVIIEPPPRTEPPSLAEPPPWEVRYYFECDGLIIPCYDYKVERVSLAERVHLQAMFPEPTAEPQKAKPAADKKVTPSLSAKRSKAGKRKAKIQDPGDILKIKKAFAVRKASGLTDNAVARELAELVNEDPKALDLKSDPYYNISPDDIRRLVGVKK